MALDNPVAKKDWWGFIAVIFYYIIFINPFIDVCSDLFSLTRIVFFALKLWI